MTVKIAKIILVLYRGMFRNNPPTCRYVPTCSQYAVEALEKYGFLKGSAKTVQRLLSCHPLANKPIYDPA